MADLETLKGLLARVRDASEGSHDLNEAIHGALRPDDPFWRAICEGRRLRAAGRSNQLICASGCNMRADSWARDAHVQDHSRSIDAAIDLVGHLLPRWDLEFDINGVGGLKKGWATLRGPDFCDSDMSQFVQTDGLPMPPPLAICAALLTALIAQAEQGGSHGA